MTFPTLEELDQRATERRAKETQKVEKRAQDGVDRAKILRGGFLGFFSRLHRLVDSEAQQKYVVAQQQQDYLDRTGRKEMKP